MPLRDRRPSGYALLPSRQDRDRLRALPPFIHLMLQGICNFKSCQTANIPLLLCPAKKHYHLCEILINGC